MISQTTIFKTSGWVTFQTMNAHQKLNPNNKVLKVNHAKLSEEEVNNNKIEIEEKCQCIAFG